ncbi:MAG: WD domain-containing protein, G-beta repeat-containing protein [Candidatus Kentron sp. G]|nr:MAG: WD domain-containing protein, G-beta repeat-containing protein [Candidatus Kentron sp. G]VFM98732.1 MAG: WD domain-containing protein, G-beta repeat-containing protein [Candidatus Kentron sp. G]VFN00472.1 MAG: WD domain-containing protein, G-beta repeat-containing protein [Candidatus Kentron sp. G]
MWDATPEITRAVTLVLEHEKTAEHSWHQPSVGWSPDGEYLATSNSVEPAVYLWRNADVGWREGNSVLNHSCKAITLPIGARRKTRNRDVELAWNPCHGNLLAVGVEDDKWGSSTIFFVDPDLANAHRVGTIREEPYVMRWSPDGSVLAISGHSRGVTFVDRDGNKAGRIEVGDWVFDISWSFDSSLIAIAPSHLPILICDARAQRIQLRIEGHSDYVSGIAFGSIDSVLASSSDDGSVRLWHSTSGKQLARIDESAWPNLRLSGLAFHPSLPTLASSGEESRVLRIWDIDSSLLHAADVVSYTSAKIVLVGESNVGKSCLAMRLAEDRYPEDFEHGTTHGMRFWPMEAEDLHPSAKPQEGQRRDVVLWDFGGQEEYQLVHQLFLHDTTLTLVLIDPTRGDVEFNRAREWNKRLEKQLGERRAVKLLVGARVDDGKKSGLINRGAIQALCDECGFTGFFETSALTGRELAGLRDALAGAIDWDNLAKTSRPELFQRIRDEIELMREAGDVVVLVADLQTSVRENRALAEPPKKPASRRFWEFWKRKVSDEQAAKTQRAVPFDDAALKAVTDQLATQGLIVKTQLTGGDDAIVLQLPVIERYAASLIVAARDNPRSVPALEASELGSPGISLPGMTLEDRVARGQERIVLEAVVELMIEHGLCFRHEGLLVFPTLLRATEMDCPDELPGSVSLYYDFSGAIDNIYASLISWLVIGQGFGRIRLWENRVEFAPEGYGACGLRKVSRGGGFAHPDVYFHDGTPTQTQHEFTHFVHQHLRASGIDVVEHFELICANTDCRYEFSREVVQNRMARGETDVVCPQCKTRVKLSEGFRQESDQQRQRDEQAERKSFALMTRVREDLPKLVASVKQRGFGRTDDEYRTDRPLRVLHLSDLHFTSEAVAETKLQWLIDDIRKGGWPSGGRFGGELDYVVISGDMTHQGTDAGFRRASEFVSLLVERFGLTAERFILAPGNHDVQELDEAYDWRMNISEEEKKRAVQEGRLFGLPNDRYNDRLKAFSEQFYHPLLQKPYPLDPARQGVATIFPETRLQFLTLNSCWEIDQFHPTRASIHPDALARMIHEADRQIDRAIMNTDVRPEEYLRIGVWHHPVADGERGIRNQEFLGNLQNNRVRVCLTGDVHEMRRDLIDYWHDNRMHVIGAGSFGAKGQDLSEGSPRLYNLLEIARDFSRIRVHTRQQAKPDGAWKGWNEWPMPDGSEGGLPYFDIHLTR